MVIKENDYTDKQKEAIEETDKNLQIIACAGSGKTEVGFFCVPLSLTVYILRATL